MSVEPALLTTLPLFARLSEGERAAIAAIAHLEDHAADLLFREGDTAGDVYVLLRGRVSLSVRVGTRGEVTFLSLGEGELIGWSSLLGKARVATGRVTQPAHLLCLPASALLSLCERDPRIGYAIMSAAFEEVAERLQQTRVQLLDLYGTRGG